MKTNNETIEEYRITRGKMASFRSYGNNGAFTIPLRMQLILLCIVSDKEGWEHVSVSVKSEVVRKGKKPYTRLPTWDEMNFIKNLFWLPDECVVQYHPPKSSYVDNAQVLHLWRSTEVEFPMPPAIMVGVAGLGLDPNNPDDAERVRKIFEAANLR